MWGEYRTAIPTNLMAIFRLSSGKHFGITCAKRHIFQTLSETRKQTRAELHSVTRLSKAHIFRHRAAVKSACQRSDATVAGLCLAKHPTGPTPLTSAVSRLEQCAIDFEHGFSNVPRGCIAGQRIHQNICKLPGELQGTQKSLAKWGSDVSGPQAGEDLVLPSLHNCKHQKKK